MAGCGGWRSGQFGFVMGREGSKGWSCTTVSSLLRSITFFEDLAFLNLVLSYRMFVRGLQASYNTFSLRTGFEIPYGDLIVFGFCCGQIMFAFLMSPETIPVEYNSW